jgi:hypothetical protein
MVIARSRVRARRSADESLWKREPHAEFFHFTQRVHNERDIRESTLRQALAKLRVHIVNARVGIRSHLSRFRALADVRVALRTLIALMAGHR